jgi:uncharacterized membrane protein YfcA
MSLFQISLLIILFFITSAIGVVTGSNSLITVPVMFQFGIEPKVAVATNMFGLLFLSIGATLPFLKKEDVIDRKRLPILILLTLIGSAIGAILVGIMKPNLMPIIVSSSMIFVVIFTFLKKDVGVEKIEPTKTYLILSYVLTFLLAIYGGLFSGGYVTILTAVYVGMFGMTFTQAVANTKVINVFSSLIASVIFAWQGLIDYKIGAILAVTMFIAAYVGAKTVTKLNDVWLKRIFLATVVLLAIKTIFDFTLR